MTFTFFLAVESFFPSVSWTYRTSTFSITLGQYSLRVWLLTISRCWITHAHVTPIKMTETPTVSKFHLVPFHLDRFRQDPGTSRKYHKPSSGCDIPLWESHENCLHLYVDWLAVTVSQFLGIFLGLPSFTAGAHQTGGSKYSWSKAHTVDLAKWFIHLELVALYTVTCVICYFCFSSRYISMCGCGCVSCLRYDLVAYSRGLCLFSYIYAC